MAGKIGWGKRACEVRRRRRRRGEGMRVTARIWCMRECLEGCQTSGGLFGAASRASPRQHGCKRILETVISSTTEIWLREIVAKLLHKRNARLRGQINVA